ncbi:MAG: hypothetical protein AB7S38_16315 [Vulcanimicrobiota bacterium]
MLSPLGGIDRAQFNNLGFSGVPNPGAGPGGIPDLSSLSPEALNGGAGDAELLQQLMQAFGQQPQDPVQQLQQEIARTEQQLQQAQAAGDQQAVTQLTQKLEQLKAQLAQLTGQGQDQGGGSPEAGGAPAGGAPSGGSPSPSGGAPSGGSPAGGSPSGGAPSGGAPSGGSPAGRASSATPSGQSGPTPDIPQVPPELAGDDKKLAEFIEGKLAGSPLAGRGLGSHFVAAGRQHDVDPLVLMAISRHETNFGRLGVGVNKHMGVGAYDSSPNAPRRWDGAVNQIYSGARTFANLRRRFGSNSRAPLAQQLAAVNGGGRGWATDRGWHRKVAGTYSNLAGGSNRRYA